MHVKPSFQVSPFWKRNTISIADQFAKRANVPCISDQNGSKTIPFWATHILPARSVHWSESFNRQIHVFTTLTVRNPLDIKAHKACSKTLLVFLSIG